MNVSVAYASIESLFWRVSNIFLFEVMEFGERPHERICAEREEGLGHSPGIMILGMGKLWQEN